MRIRATAQIILNNRGILILWWHIFMDFYDVILLISGKIKKSF